jgi:hypothetical protein
VIAGCALLVLPGADAAPSPAGVVSAAVAGSCSGVWTVSAKRLLVAGYAPLNVLVASLGRGAVLPAPVLLQRAATAAAARVLLIAWLLTPPPRFPTRCSPAGSAGRGRPQSQTSGRVATGASNARASSKASVSGGRGRGCLFAYESRSGRDCKCQSRRPGLVGMGNRMTALVGRQRIEGPAGGGTLGVATLQLSTS